MATRLRILPAFLVVGMITALIAGCNMFGFTSDAEKTPIEKAEDSIRDGNYAKARQELTDANGALLDSTNSMLVYTYSKAVLLESGLTIARIADLVQVDKGTSQNGNLALLDEIDNLDYPTQTIWYQANREIAGKLSHIWKLETTGEMTKDDIALDYSISNIMGGVLSLRDTNRDNIIDDGDFKINLSEVNKVIGGSPTNGFDFNGITDNGTSYPGLTAFLGTPVVNLKLAKAAGIEGYTPDDINPLIASLLEFLDQGEESVLFFIQNLDGASSYDPEDIRDFIPKVAKIINYYWYYDGIDNDGDGRIDEEIINGESEDDDNGDGVIDGNDLIDEDSGYMSDYDFTNIVNTVYIPLYEKWKNR